MNDHSSSRETCVRRERSNNESMSECNKRLTQSEEASSSGVEASLESRGVMREVRPNKESRNGMKEGPNEEAEMMPGKLVSKVSKFFITDIDVSSSMSTQWRSMA